MRLFRRRPPVPLPEQLAVVVDEIAEAFNAHPGLVTRLLLDHAGAAFAWDALLIDPMSADHEIAMAVAEADRTREALLCLSHAAAVITRTRTTLETDR
jgi:class 3 adenylate cyclase